jgi:hypothetical protein
MISEDLWKSDRVIEVPDNISTAVADAVAQRLTAVLHEEVSKCIQESAELRVVPMGGPAFQDILEHVINSVLTPLKGGLTIIRTRPREPRSPNIIVDHDTVDRICRRFVDPDFKNKAPEPDKRLYNDDLPATTEPPETHKGGTR